MINQQQALEALEAHMRIYNRCNQMQSPSYTDLECVRIFLKQLAHPPKTEDAPKLWLWQNFVDGRPEYWAFDNPYPINLTDGDPQTLGEPCGYAIFKPSRQGRFDKSEEQVIAAIKKAKP